MSIRNAELASPRYEMVQMNEINEINENFSADNHSANLAVSSLHNTCETIRTAILSASKWIVKHPIQCAIAGSSLLALGLGAGLGLPALLRNKDGVRCSELDVLYFGANKGAEFVFAEIKNSESHILAELSKNPKRENSHIYLNTSDLCKSPEDILSNSFLVGCTNMNAIKLEPKELDQPSINAKLNGTRCDPQTEADLIFTNSLKSGEKKTLELDAKRMCDENKISNFQVNSSSLTIDNINFNRTQPTLYIIDTATHCHDIFNETFVLKCGEEKYSFIPKLNLTAGSVNSLNFGACTVTKENSQENSSENKVTWSLLSAAKNDSIITPSTKPASAKPSATTQPALTARPEQPDLERETTAVRPTAKQPTPAKPAAKPTSKADANPTLPPATKPASPTSTRAPVSTAAPKPTPKPVPKQTVKVDIALRNKQRSTNASFQYKITDALGNELANTGNGCYGITVHLSCRKNNEFQVEKNQLPLRFEMTTWTGGTVCQRYSFSIHGRNVENCYHLWSYGFAGAYVRLDRQTYSPSNC